MKWLLLCAAFVSVESFADEKLWSQLQKGGNVVLIRHALTTPGSGDPPGFKLDDCSTQRNLTDDGRRHAVQIRNEFEKRRIPVERVLSSPWCRCIETAKLAFGRMDETSTPLSNLFGRHENRERQMAELRRIASAKPKGNLILVTHGSVVLPLTGISPATGEMVILSQGKVAGRLALPARSG